MSERVRRYPQRPMARPVQSAAGLATAVNGGAENGAARAPATPSAAPLRRAASGAHRPAGRAEFALSERVAVGPASSRRSWTVPVVVSVVVRWGLTPSDRSIARARIPCDTPGWAQGQREGQTAATGDTPFGDLGHTS